MVEIDKTKEERIAQKQEKEKGNNIYNTYIYIRFVLFLRCSVYKTKSFQPFCSREFRQSIVFFSLSVPISLYVCCVILFQWENRLSKKNEEKEIETMLLLWLLPLCCRNGGVMARLARITTTPRQKRGTTTTTTHQFCCCLSSCAKMRKWSNLSFFYESINIVSTCSSSSKKPSLFFIHVLLSFS